MRGITGRVSIAVVLAVCPVSAVAQENYNSVMSDWFRLVAEHKVDEAAGMMISDVTYRYEANDTNLLLSKRIFVEWLGHCKPGLSIPMPASKDGGETRIFHVYCRKRGEDGSYGPDFTDSINFFVTASASGIRVW